MLMTPADNRVKADETDSKPVLSISNNVVPRQDLLRRFTATPYSTDLQIMRRAIRLETNDEDALKLASRFFTRHHHGTVDDPQFVWRIIVQPDMKVQSDEVEFVAFSHAGARYANLNHRNFVAVDTDNRQAVGYLGDGFFIDTADLKNNRALDLLFCLTAPSLGITAMAGGCVGIGDRGVLVFGPPNSGKTTACYLAAKMGMEFHADQAVFLDMRRGVLEAWGDLYPAVFRPQTLEFLPELRQSTRSSTHGGLSFFYLDKSKFQTSLANAVNPVCSIVLERNSSEYPQVRRLSHEDIVSRLYGHLLFQEDQRFDAQIAESLNALACQPAYSLRYGGNPQNAADLIEKILR